MPIAAFMARQGIGDQRLDPACRLGGGSQDKGTPRRASSWAKRARSPAATVLLHRAQMCTQPQPSCEEAFLARSVLLFPQTSQNCCAVAPTSCFTASAFMLMHPFSVVLGKCTGVRTRAAHERWR